MHAFPVEIFDGLVDRAVGGVIVCEPEALPPVAKVRGDDEERRGAIQVPRQELAVNLLATGVDRAHQDGYKREGMPAHHVGDVGQVHLQAVLVLVDVHRHPRKLPGRRQLRAHRAIYRNVPEWGLVRRCPGHRTSSQVNMVRRPKEEDAGNLRRVDVDVAEGRRLPRVRVARMWSNDRFEFPLRVEPADSSRRCSAQVRRQLALKHLGFVRVPRPCVRGPPLRRHCRARDKASPVTEKVMQK
mmetsp:Transcript_11651/g.29669  ORF Transcript_11651/g.29669 Transcript_11651/m.29669 type:complete len:242 (-) Transcript_11651:34-759(-)